MKERRRSFLLKCLGLGAATIRPRSAIPSTFPEPRFQFGQKVQQTLIFDDGEVSVETGRVIGMNYESSDRQKMEWHYLIAWENCYNQTHDKSYTPDQAEPSFVFESELKAV